LHYDDKKKIHFIGIGGSGMCPMAEILYGKGYEITGSDVYMSDTLERIIKNGVKVYMSHDPKNVEGADIVAYSAAIKQDNPEIIRAKELGIPVFERSVMLGMVASNYSTPIAVAGSHGKTTTTAMLTSLLIDAQLDPSAIIGGRLNSLGGNSHIGNGDIMICEACEYVDSFLEIHPKYSIILNVDADHLDYFKTFENVKKSFRKFAGQTSSAVFVNGDDKDALFCVKNIKPKVVTFGFGKYNDYTAENIKKDNTIFESFTFKYKGESLCDIKLKVPGKHNIINALAAASLAHEIGVKPEDIKLSLNEFSGVHRRFEVLGSPNGIMVADDFAHHPTEISAILSCAMDMGFNRVWAVFQPHTFSRTALHLDDFAKSLSIADKVVMSEILPVRETNTYNIYTKDLAEKIPGSVWFDTFEEIADHVTNNALPGDLVLTMGGGNVYRCANMILNKLNTKARAL
jgi:UDP-N-acetylmuramate--alanine ligase